MNKKNLHTCIYSFFEWGVLSEFKNDINNPWFLFMAKKKKTSNRVSKNIQKYYDEIISQL